MLSTEEKPNLDQIRRKIFRIERLSAMPQVVWQLLEALADENTSIARLEKLIESDPALASKVLKLANSSYYSLAEEVTTIGRAVAVIGFLELEILVVGAGLADIFDLDKMQSVVWGEELWYHCLAVSWLSQALAKKVRYPVPAEIMVAGLMHDVGKLVLATHLPEESARLGELVRQGMPFFMAEGELGIRHSTIGYWLAKRWGLPGVHAGAIRDHLSPRPDDPYYLSTCLVFLANRMTKRLRFGLVQESPPVIQSEAMEAVKLSRDHLQEVMEAAKKEVPPILEKWRQMRRIRQF